MAQEDWDVVASAGDRPSVHLWRGSARYPRRHHSVSGTALAIEIGLRAVRSNRLDALASPKARLFRTPRGLFVRTHVPDAAGESGSWFGIAPNEAKALPTALAIRPPIGNPAFVPLAVDEGLAVTCPAVRWA
jgi:hypothetical protein